MRTVGNIIWAVLFGWWLAILYFLEAIVLCVTIIFIPVGIQYFKLGRFLFAPFGKMVVYHGGGFKTVINIIWLIIGGWENALILCLAGAIICLTIVGIPVGLQVFKACRFVLFPVGSSFENQR